jgi:hypothetical protein
MDRPELLATNPVLVLDDLADEHRSEAWLLGAGELDGVVTALRAEGVVPPAAACFRWHAEGRLSRSHLPATTDSQPWRGVLGLAQDLGREVAYVVPLAATRSTHWRTDWPLPPRVEAVADLLRAVCAAANAAEPHSVDAHAFPEVVGVAVSTRFPLAIDGPSMDVAMLLAALGLLAGDRQPLLQSACAAVQVEGGSLRPVGHAAAKLGAFAREVGRGSLLVCSPECEAAAVASKDFDVVWCVATVADLAQRLHGAGLLRAFAEPTPMDPVLGAHLLARLDALAEQQGRHAEVVDFAQRLLAAAWTAAVPPRMRLAAKRYLPAALRHLGRYEEALTKSRDWQAHVDGSDLFAIEDQAQAALEVAASLFDPGREQDALATLRTWLDTLDREPRLVSARTRVRIWNTAARAMVLSGDPAWATWFERSLAMQAKDDPASLERTRNYYVAGCLRTGQLERAERLLASSGEEPVDVWRAFLLADLARRQGRVWMDPACDAAAPSPATANHALGFYLQATARQPIAAAAAAERFARAAACFQNDLGGRDRSNVLWVLLHAMEFAAARARDDAAAANASARALRTSVTQAGLEDLHAKVAAVLPKDVRSDIEPLLVCLPWL